MISFPVSESFADHKLLTAKLSQQTAVGALSENAPPAS
jgi:hypothetical protein